MVDPVRSKPTDPPRRIAIVAGEVSGDLIAAPLIEALKKIYPDAEFRGVVGPRMQAAGCQRIESIEALSLFGIGEIITEIPRLFKLRASLYQQFIDWQPDVFIGVDAPSFNLGLEKKLKQAGIPTVHYVSPTLWAWREGRVKGIRESVDLMLSLFPFEARFYESHAVDVRFVGHPLADSLPLDPDRSEARALLNIDEDAQVVAVLPGSRGSEVSRLSGVFVETMAWLQQRLPKVQFVVPLANEKARVTFESALAAEKQLQAVHLLDGQSHEAMTASDVVLLASGTAALESCLLKRPTVAAYRIHALTYLMLSTFKMLKIENVTLPNNLSDKVIIPEFFRNNDTAENMAVHLYRWLTKPWTQQSFIDESYRIHEALRLNASERAAEAVSELMEKRL